MNSNLLNVLSYNGVVTLIIRLSLSDINGIITTKTKSPGQDARLLILIVKLPDDNNYHIFSCKHRTTRRWNSYVVSTQASCPSGSLNFVWTGGLSIGLSVGQSAYVNTTLISVANFMSRTSWASTHSTKGDFTRTRQGILFKECQLYCTLQRFPYRSRPNQILILVCYSVAHRFAERLLKFART